ncbi:MAG TPA: hypothetical protein V6C97_00700 [Oculatellaceae cyanobacterium]
MNNSISKGAALVVNTAEGLHARAHRSESLHVQSVTDDGQRSSFECEMKLETLRQHAAAGDFFSYSCGCAAAILSKCVCSVVDSLC